MPKPKGSAEAGAIARGIMETWLDEVKKNYKEETKCSDAEADAWQRDQRRRGLWGYQKSKNNGLWKKLWANRKIKSYLSPKTDTQRAAWFADHMLGAFPTKVKEMPAKGVGKRIAVGEVHSRASKMKEEAAKQNGADGLGLHLVFGPNTNNAIAVSDALLERDQGGAATVVPGCLGIFTEEDADERADERVFKMLQKLAVERKTTAADILGGETVSEFVAHSSKNLKDLEELAREMVVSFANDTGLTMEEDEDQINAMSTNTFLTLANICCQWHDLRELCATPIIWYLVRTDI